MCVCVCVCTRSRAQIINFVLMSVCHFTFLAVCFLADLLLRGTCLREGERECVCVCVCAHVCVYFQIYI